MASALVRPLRYLSSVLCLEPDWLVGQGVRALLLDIDNTLVSRDSGELTDEVRDWVGQLRGRGLKLCLLTNNWHKTVHAFAAELGLPIVVKALKPLPFAFWRAMGKVGVGRGEAVMVGDQAITDGLGARLAGMRSVLVVPMTQTDLAYTRLLRRLEPWLLGGMQPEPGAGGGAGGGSGAGAP